LCKKSRKGTIGDWVKNKEEKKEGKANKNFSPIMIEKSGVR